MAAHALAARLEQRLSQNNVFGHLPHNRHAQLPLPASRAWYNCSAKASPAELDILRVLTNAMCVMLRHDWYTDASFTPFELRALPHLPSDPYIIECVTVARELSDLITVDAALQNYLTDVCGVPLCDAQNWLFPREGSRNAESYADLLENIDL